MKHRLRVPARAWNEEHDSKEFHKGKLQKPSVKIGWQFVQRARVTMAMY